MAILNEYGIEAWHKDKKSRVRLATLKLAHGDLAALKRAIETAKQDFRDVLGPAEYPESMQAWAQLNRMSRKERERVVKSDWEQYETWLHGDVKQVQP
ncbi:MAG TPA: hypothetical protein VLK33_05825 [Terriglobales bacterium]|nr:hypothetical protein [Terriglobales bacterium]